MSEDRPPRTVVITGASSGIGRATAHRLAEQGASLVLASRSLETLQQAQQECVSRGASEVLCVPTDVSDREQVDALFAAALDRFGRIDGVVHAAGVVAYGKFVEVPAEVFEQVIGTIVLGTGNVARRSLRLFEEQGDGSIVVLGSVLGKIATPYMASYCTAKWAVQGLVRTLQIETRDQPGVTVSLVTPGGVNTPIYDLAGTFLGRPGNPPPPVVSPEQVAAKVVAALDQQGRDVAVGPANWLMVTGFRVLPGLYDAVVGPMMRTLGLGEPNRPADAGNVFEPVPEKEAVHGRWPNVLGRTR